MDRIEGVNFSLPPDHARTDEFFAGRKWDLSAPLQLRVGLTNWGRKDWVGRLYPKGTKDKDFLAFYTKQYACIELNALFYHLQPRPVIEKWASLADDGFRYCPKFTNTISHTRQLAGSDQDTALFIEHMKSFGNKLGPAFLQLSDRYAPDRAGLLQEYVSKLPRDFKTCIELRQEDWYREGVAAKATWQTFRERGIGTVITDTAGRRDCLHMILTAPFAFIRFVGNNLHPTDYTRVDEWAERIKTWIDKGLREIYFFIHTPDEMHSPELSKYVVDQFNKVCGAGLKPPKILQDEPPAALTLF